MTFDILTARIAFEDAEREIVRQTDRRMMADFPFVYKKLQEVYPAGWEKSIACISELAAQTQIPEELLALWFCLQFSVDYAYPKYKAQGIPDEIFCATMGNALKYMEWTRLRANRFGILLHPFFRSFCNLLELHAFRIGTMNFERINIECDLEVDGAAIKKGDPCISVHIPRGCDFTESTCEATFAAAKAFFQKYYGLETVFCHCWSWLMHPWISEMLPKSSNLVKFQQKFKLYSVGSSKTSPLEYVFPEHYKPGDTSFEHYPENTSLQKALKDRLRKDLPVGASKGIRLL